MGPSGGNYNFNYRRYADSFRAAGSFQAARGFGIRLKELEGLYPCYELYFNLGCPDSYTVDNPLSEKIGRI